MKSITFTYTKADNSVSRRTLVVSNEPGKFVSGTDISELSTEDQVLYIGEVEQARGIYLEMLKEINDRFDTNHNYRQFDASRMSDIEEI